MNKILATAMILMLSVSTHAKTILPESRTIEGRVVSIADGDTLTVLDSNNVQHKIRIHAIDAPELGQPFGKAAKATLSDLCYNQKAVIKPVDVDRYSRIVGDVHCGERGHPVSFALIRKGMAWVYDRYVDNDTHFLYSVQKAAQADHIDLPSFQRTV